LIHDVAFLSKCPEWLAILPSLPPSPPHGTDRATLDAFSVVFKAALAPLWAVLNGRYSASLDAHGLTAPSIVEVRDVLIALGRWADAVRNPPPPPPPPPHKPATKPRVGTAEERAKERRALRDEMVEMFARLAAQPKCTAASESLLSLLPSPAAAHEEINSAP